MTTLVIVEAPTKAKTISQYLGDGYKVLASYGHVRDLPRKTGSVQPDKDFALSWEVVSKATKHLDAIASTLKTVDTLVLATDPDREGEAISWHLYEYLKSKKLLREDLIVQRVSFNSITKESILEALKHPREINLHLVEAYLARLSLDYLVGFTLSPILWRKLPGSRSAGRVQSVALRMVVEREQEIKIFQVQDYWTLHGMFSQGIPFESVLTHYQGAKLEKFSISSQQQAEAWKQVLEKATYYVENVQTKGVQRHPAAPFITSSLQQEASRKLGYSPSRTMQIAQKLYEGVHVHGETMGLITYMRTDSPVILPEAIEKLRIYAKETWGNAYLSEHVRVYKPKAHSQEGHEAIRPTAIALTPQSLKESLPPEQWALYKLIWERTLASQMASAQFEQTSVILQSHEGGHAFRTTGSVMIFDGFLVLYEEAKEAEEAAGKGIDSKEEPMRALLPPIKVEAPVVMESLVPEPHETQPPPRFSEASLIKKLEDLGIGRPSTYARILEVLQERGYVALEKKRMAPKELGMIVTAFLRKCFAQYVDYHFTADLESQLDRVSAGEETSKELLHGFWPDFLATVKESELLKIADVLEMIEGDVVGEEKRVCSRCHEGWVSLRLSKMGPFMACSRYPECKWSSGLSPNSEWVEPRTVGTHPDTGQDILIKRGPYGWYVEHEGVRASVSVFAPETLTLTQALWLLSMPKVLGIDPETEQEIVMGIGKFGPYVRFNGRFYSIKTGDLEAFSLEDARILIHNAPEPKKKPVSKEESPKVKLVSKAKAGKGTSKKRISKKT
jgi:DNA topoisomerase-1